MMPKTDLPLELAAAPFALADRAGAAVVLTLGMHAARVMVGAPAGADRLDVLFHAFAPEGQPRGSTRIGARLSRSPGATGDARFEILGRLDLGPGRYELRASAAGESSERSGSVYGYFEVPDFAKELLSLSGVAMGITPPSVSGNADAAAGIVPATPTSRRTFVRTDRVTSFARVYQGSASALARVIGVVRVVDSRDQPVVEQLRTFEANAFGANRSADFQFDLPMDRLAPGSYVLTITASLGERTVRRDVRFEVR
jgi:hypothetical protein